MSHFDQMTPGTDGGSTSAAAKRHLVGLFAGLFVCFLLWVSCHDYQGARHRGVDSKDDKPKEDNAVRYKPGPSVREQKTREYWEELRKASEGMEAIRNDPAVKALAEDKPPETAEGILEIFDRGIKGLGVFIDAMDKQANRLRELPVVNVDPEAAEAGTELIAALDRNSLVYREMRSRITDFKDFIKQNVGVMGLLELMFIGDARLKKAGAEHEERIKATYAKMEKEVERFVALSTKLRKLRITLTHRYGQEFDDLAITGGE
jgi:hypothetical protein